MNANSPAFVPFPVAVPAAGPFVVLLTGRLTGVITGRFTPIFAALSIGLLAVLLPCVSQASTRTIGLPYEFSELAPLTGTFSSARAINNAGKVAGFSSVEGSYYERAVMWDDSVPVRLNTPPAGFSAANAINNAGQIAGSSSLFPPHPHVAHQASLWSRAQVTRLGSPGASQPSVANAVNDNGEVAGWSGLLPNSGYRATVWNGPASIELSPLPGWAFSSAQAINNSGQVAGYSTLPIGADPSVTDPYRATLWNGMAPTDLGTLGGQFSFASAINDAGQVAGWAELASPAEYHAALWSSQKDLGAIDLGTLGGRLSAASAINNAGQVVGWAEDTHNIQHAALWNGTMGQDLNIFLDADSAKAGWVLLAANGINDHGWIVGDAVNNVTHQFRGFLLAPVPEPGTYAMFLAGLGLIAFIAHRYRLPAQT